MLKIYGSRIWGERSHHETAHCSRSFHCRGGVRRGMEAGRKSSGDLDGARGHPLSIQHSEHSHPGPSDALAGIRIRISPSDFGYELAVPAREVPQSLRGCRIDREAWHEALAPGRRLQLPPCARLLGGPASDLSSAWARREKDFAFMMTSYREPATPIPSCAPRSSQLRARFTLSTPRGERFEEALEAAEESASRCVKTSRGRSPSRPSAQTCDGRFSVRSRRINSRIGKRTACRWTSRIG